MGKSFEASHSDANIPRSEKANPVRRKRRRFVKETQSSDEDSYSAIDGNGQANELSNAIDVDNEDSTSNRYRTFSDARPTESSAETSESNPASLSTSTALPQGRGRLGLSKPGLNRVQLPTPDGKLGRRHKTYTEHATAIVMKYVGEVPYCQFCVDQTLKHLGGTATPKEIKELDIRHSISEENTCTGNGPENSMTAAAMPAVEESPIENLCESSSEEAENETNGRAARNARSRDRPVRALSRSNVNTEAKGTDVDLMDLPIRMRSVSYPIPSNMISLDLCPKDLVHAPGIEEDDLAVLREALDISDWLHSAELLDLGDDSRNFLASILPLQFANRMGEMLPLFVDSNVLELFTARGNVDQDKLLAIVGLCARFLNANVSKDLLTNFSKYLLSCRQKQIRNQRTDSLKFALRSQLPTGRHQLLLFIWTCLSNACQKSAESNDRSVLWQHFNSEWFGEGKQKPDTDEKFASTAQGTELFDALELLSGLQSLSLKPESEVPSSPIEFVPNWTAIKFDLDGILALKCSSVLEHREVLKERLQRVCYQFADRLWKVDESIVLKALDTTRAVCAKYETSCSCSSIPIFLSRFSSISDFRARRQSIKDVLDTECDCALFLAWIFVSQQSEIKPGMSGRILHNGMTFMRAKGVVSDRANAFTHYLGLVMAVADSFVKVRNGKESQLCKTLFSKAPKLDTAVENKSWIVKAWLSLFSAVNLRCRQLLACGQSVENYVVQLLKEVASILRFLNEPEVIVGTTVGSKEDRRVKHGIFIEILKEILSTLVSIFDLCIRSIDESQLGASKVVDSFLLKVVKSTKAIGSFYQGLISAYGSSASGASSRVELMLALQIFFDKVTLLCTCRQEEERRVAAQGISVQFCAASSTGTFAKILHTSMLESLLSIARSAVFGIESDSDVDLRCAASRTLARIVGLCSIGSDPVYIRGTNNVVDLLVQARLDALQGSWLNLQPCAENISESKEHTLKLVEFLVQAEFWSDILGGSWSSNVLSLSDDMEQMVLSLWIILLVTSHGEGEESKLGKIVAKFSVGIQRSARTSPVVGRWFYQTAHGRKCQNAELNDPMSHGITFKLDAEDRLEAVVDCLSIILKSWQPLAVLKLIDILRKFICLSGKIMVRRYEEFNASQKFFRTSKDVHDGMQTLFFAQILAVLFVIEASQERPQPQHVLRPATQKPKSVTYLPEISDLMTKAFNKLRKKMDNTEHACVRVQALVITGLSSMKSIVRDLELSLLFSRFLQSLGGAPYLEGFLWDDKEKLGSFLWRPPYIVASFIGQEGAKGSGIMNKARQFRLQALTVLVQSPIRRKPVDSTEFRSTVEALLKLLKNFSIPSLRKAGMWPTVSTTIKLLGDRKKKDGTKFGVALNDLIEDLWSTLSRFCHETESKFFAEALGT